MNQRLAQRRDTCLRPELTVHSKSPNPCLSHSDNPFNAYTKTQIIVGEMGKRNTPNCKLLILCLFFVFGWVKGFSQEKKVFIDFGPNDVTNGTVTTNPDANGNHWNNVVQPTTAASALTLVDSKNTGTGISLKITGNFSTNGILNGGLLAPKSDLLGDLAIKTATQDYFYVTGSTGSFKLTGLDPKKKYVFTMFACREATDVRISQYKFTGTNSSTVTLQTTGAGIGSGGFNGNNDKVVKSDFLYADANGAISFELSSTAGSFAYINAMKIDVFEGDEKPKDWSKLYLDLGPKDLTNGNITASPDLNGNAWNNLSIGNTGEMVSLLDASGKVTGVLATVNKSFQINGILNGGLLSPKAELLSDFAINTATQDYFYTDGTGTISFTGLSKDKKYVFYLFGSRESTETRISEYKLTGANISTKELTTSGAGIGANGFNGNNNKIVLSDAVYPDLNGTITLDVKKITGAFAHLNAVKIIAADKTGDEKYSLDNQGFELGDLTYWTKTAPDAGSVTTVGREIKHEGSFSLLMGGASSNISQTITAAETVSAYKLSGYFFQPLASTLTKNQEGYLLISCYDVNNNLLTTARSTAITSSSSKGQWIKLTSGLTVAKNTKFIKASVVWNNPEKGAGNLYFDDLSLEVYNPLSVAYLGSSVPWGQGATNNKGYTSIYTDILKSRESKGGKAWLPVNISVPGDNTVKVLNRYDADLLSQKGKYVIFALALGNEGIHEQGQPAFDQFQSNIKILIDKARSDGYIPVITNSYTRGDYNETDYKFVKRMNLLIHMWNLPSVNLLGAVDDLSGRWVNGFWSDTLHPNDAGHAELAYAIVPSLFDALDSNKPIPKRVTGSQISLPKNSSKSKAIVFTPENIVHPFTTTVSFKANEPGTLLQVENTSGTGTISINNNGFLVYTSAVTGAVTGTSKVNDDKWHKLTVTHYYAKGQTMIYADSTLQGSLNEKLLTKGVKIGGADIPKNLAFKNWLFYRSGMTLDEVKYLAKDSLLKSSLELYAPLDGKLVSVTDSLINLAQSTNTISEISSVIPPSGLSYKTPNTYLINSNITPLAPTVTGGISAYTITPILPTGLTLNPVTGVISGIPAAASSKAFYQATATNEAGSTTFAFVITVVQEVSVKMVSQTDATKFGAIDGSANLLASGGTPPYQYKLNNGDFQNSTSFTKLEAKQYIATARDADGALATFPFIIKQPAKITETTNGITNAFSPNGDGINDNWIISDIESYPSHHLTITDRAGKVVYSVKNYKNEWNGMWNGNYVREGTYYYSIVFENGELPAKKGFITIVR
ncbi:gliding motility-associated C-terminal domain-containing protein [Pedobacter miscanthi]|uniref:T9SS type B sorting domain-containing protein n=1 Tax=Pedobacter miscanthi TaxID=2259170 RepID=UPI0029302C8C|nr:gliding motility-associated C-terminal domain-containing protein [Pedobacter miscanthi]